MVTMCFVAKSPQPTTRVFGLGDIGIPLEEFQKEVLSLVAIPDAAMPATGLEEGDSFCFSSRGRIRGQTWTWFGHYRHAVDPGGRKGAYFAVGVLLLNQTCKGPAVADMIDALEDFFRSEVLEDRRRIPENWQALRLSTPVKLLSTETDAHVGELRPGFGLSPETSRLVYRRESLTFAQVGIFLDEIQSDAGLQPFGRIVFGPSVHFAEKLSARFDLNAFDRPPAGSPEAPDRAMVLRSDGNRAAQNPPATMREAMRISDSDPAINASVLERKMSEIRGALSEMQQVAYNNHRGILLHRRVVWLCVAIGVMLAGYGSIRVIDGAIANTELTQERTGRVVDILSAEIGTLKAEIARLRIAPKPPAARAAKPPATGRHVNTGDSGGDTGLDNTHGNTQGSHHQAGTQDGATGHSATPEGGGGAAGDLHGASHAPSGKDGTKKNCRDPDGHFDPDHDDSKLPVCDVIPPHKHTHRHH